LLLLLLLWRWLTALARRSCLQPPEHADKEVLARVLLRLLRRRSRWSQCTFHRPLLLSLLPLALLCLLRFKGQAGRRILPWQGLGSWCLLLLRLLRLPLLLPCCAGLAEDPLAQQY
jgi:hypothetical protein